MTRYTVDELILLEARENTKSIKNSIQKNTQIQEEILKTNNEILAIEKQKQYKEWFNSLTPEQQAEHIKQKKAEEARKKAEEARKKEIERQQKIADEIRRKEQEAFERKLAKYFSIFFITLGPLLYMTIYAFVRKLFSEHNFGYHYVEGVAFAYWLEIYLMCIIFLLRAFILALKQVFKFKASKLAFKYFLICCLGIYPILGFTFKNTVYGNHVNAYVFSALSNASHSFLWVSTSISTASKFTVQMAGTGFNKALNLIGAGVDTTKNGIDFIGGGKLENTNSNEGQQTVKNSSVKPINSPSKPQQTKSQTTSNKTSAPQQKSPPKKQGNQQAHKKNNNQAELEAAKKAEEQMRIFNEQLEQLKTKQQNNPKQKQ